MTGHELENGCAKAGQARLERLYGRRAGAVPAARAFWTPMRGLRRGGQSARCRHRTGGNHRQPHRPQQGCVLAAAVNLDTLAAASPRGDKKVCLESAGYAPLTLDLSDLSPREEEKNSTAALIRGVAARMAALGYQTGGFDAAVTSQVLSGSGLSSSAAFEVAMAAVFDALYNGFSLPAGLRAQIGQHAENAYFGKPSGLMDQMASSVGGLVAIDFGQEEAQVQALPFSFAASGYRLIVVDTRGSHDDLTPAYSAIQKEMQAVARTLGAETLRARDKAALMNKLPQIRQATSDRAILRALHFYHENERVEQAVAALKASDLPLFFRMVRESGLSSWTMLQNLYAHPGSQPLALALAAAGEVLGEEGACRVHGGGFAGTTLNFVPEHKLGAFVACMDALFGEEACHVLDVRAEGAADIGTA